MEPSEIRSELIGDHNELRGIMGRAAELVAALRGGAPMRNTLRETLGALADATHAHNAHEEGLLRGIIPTVDAWGPARADVMYEQHRLEHQELHDAILRCCEAMEAEALCAEVDAVLARMAAHMAREEEAFLGADVLRDDSVVIDSFGG